MIPESRKDDGLFLRRPIRENVSLTSLGGLSRFGFVRTGEERARVRDALDRVTAPQSRMRRRDAVGWQPAEVAVRPRGAHRASVLIADEPTRGVDVGAKHDLYQLLVSFAAGGLAILLISNEIEEILGLSHRVLVMRGGRLVAEFAGEAMTEEAIVAAAFGAAAGVRHERSGTLRRPGG